MAAVRELTPALGAGAACRAMGLWRGASARQQARVHRVALVGPRAQRAARPRPPLALDAQENQVLLDTLNSERFVDTAPATVHATLLDEGRYLGSVRTMYRLLAIHGGCRERRDQLTHPAYTKPELLALAPNQVWSWDITKLKGPAKWTCFHLYVILDIFSRHVVGWLLAERESAELAEQLITDTVQRHDIEPGMLTLHADRGASMRSKPVAALLVDLDIAKSHSRPHVSDDKAYASYCTSFERSGTGTWLWGARRGLGAWCRVLRMVARRLVQAFVFVAVWVSTKQAALQPPLDRRGRDLQRGSHFLQRQ